MRKREGRFLLNDAVSCQDQTASAVDELGMGTEHCCSYTDSEKPKYTPIATLPTTNFTLTGLGSNLDLHVEGFYFTSANSPFQQSQKLMRSGLM
jgi:hypothetical protein